MSETDSGAAPALLFAERDETTREQGTPEAQASPVAQPSSARPFEADPESLVLRGAPKGIVRFRKGLLVGAAAFALVAFAGISWIALEPAGLQLASEERDLSAALTDAAPEELSGLPQGYGDGAPVPELGPPLPGDLGRPILAHQREMATEDGGAPAPTYAPDTRAQEAEAERQRRMAEIDQARGAPVLMQVSRSTAPTGSVDSPSDPATVSASPGSSENPNRLTAPGSRWHVSAGSVIAASLVTGLNSDLPGLVVAQVTEPVFDSATGRAILIPQGARLLGRYDAKVAFGQRRAMLVWDRLVMPDGRSIALDNAPATDAAGYAGVSDRVDFHTWQLLRGVGLSTLLGVGTELTFGDGETDLIRSIRESIQSNADRAGQKMVERNLDIAPTITVRPGFPVRVLVHKDLVLPPWRE